MKNNKPQLRQAERCTNVTGRGEEHLVSSEGRASVDELQHQLMQIKVTYQQFRVQYDLLIETQQQTLLEYQRLVPEMEKKAQELNAVREKLSDKIQIMEKVEQLRRKQLKEDVENKQAELPLLNPRQECGNQGETGQLQNQADAIQRLLIASNTIAWKENGMRLQAELIETRILNEDLNRQLEMTRKSGKRRKHGCTRTKRNAEKEAAKDKKSALETDLQALRDVKRLINDQVVSETRAVDKLEEKIKALQSENVALRLASTHTPVALIDIAGAKEKCEQVEIERKLQRRVDILTLHLNEKQMIVANKDTCCRNRILNLESELQFEQARHEKEHLTQNASVPAANSMFAKQQVEELEFPNAFLRERLALSRKEWRKPFSAKMTSNKAQLQHLRWRLVQNSVSFNSSAPDHDMNDTIGHGSNSQIQREEQHFLVGQEVQEESLAHSNELRNKKQQVMAKNTRLLELELENESLRLEYVRLRRKTRYGSGDLQDAQKQLSGAKGIGSGGRRSLWAAHEWLELEDVVKKMKALIEELRAENKKLKKATAKQASVFLEREDSMRRKLKEQKDVQKRLEVQLQKPHHESSELKKDKLRHQEKLCAKAATLSLRKKLSNLLKLQLKEKDW
ncbi:unnamed protein product [Peronospora destructor]|uniref:Uncharacterized protein n=1 Tax=Peronospora destructor TaxID=86335 RepID=A0AAV0THM6_9STRA|nr:unnamed protein product [Peronospora destructor]